MTKVKICGITCMEDVDIVNALKPDYIGFVFAPSKRQLTMAQAKQLAGRIDNDIGKVGVFVNAAADTVIRIQEECDLQAVQLHGDESNDMCRGYACDVWKAIRVKDQSSLDRLQDYDVDAFVLDAYAAHAYGGLGIAFDWKLIEQSSSKPKIFLAGGLTPGNIREAMDVTNVYGVDVSSGIETDGKKDFDKVKQFIAEVRNGR